MNLKELAGKVGKTEEELNKELQEIYQQEKKTRANLSEEQLQLRANRKFSLQYQAEIKSRAKEFQGVFFGVGGAIDTLKKIKDLIDKPELLEQAGYTINTRGKIVDKRELLPSGFPNPNFNHPIREDSYMRVSFGKCTSGELGIEEPTEFTMIASRGETWKLEAPRFKVVNFRANLARTSTKDRLQLTAATITNFALVKGKEIASIPEILENTPGRFMPLVEVEPWYQKHSGEKDRTIITVGDVLEIRSMTTRDGEPLKIIVLTDKGMPEKDTKGNPYPGISVFVPRHLFGDVTFGKFSRIYAIGAVSSGTVIDFETGEREEGGVTISGMGLYPIPEYTEPAEESSENEALL